MAFMNDRREGRPTVEVFDAELVLMFKLLNFLEGCLFVAVLFILLRLIETFRDVIITDKQDLNILIVEVLWFYCDPGETAKLFENPIQQLVKDHSVA